MRIAHLTYLLDAAGGGIPPVLEAVVAAQRHLGDEVGRFGVMSGSSTEATLPAGQRVGAFTIRGPRALGFSPELAPALRAFNPELVHLHGLFTAPSEVARAWGSRTRRPVVVSPHGMLEPWALANARWKKRLFRLLVEDRNLRQAACLHALCGPEAANISALGFQRPVAVIPNGVDLAPFTPLPSPERFHARVPEARSRPVLLFLSRIHPKKGLPMLVEAWSKLPRGDWLLAIAGPDQLGHEAEIRAQVRARALEREVAFTGPLHGEDKASAFAAASGFVLPSHSEGFSMAVLEAMAARLPVLITHPCNFDEVATVGAGWVEDATVDGVTRMVGAFLEASDGERRAMGAKGRARVEAAYTWPRIAAQYLDVYRWLLSGGPRPATVRP